MARRIAHDDVPGDGGDGGDGAVGGILELLGVRRRPRRDARHGGDHHNNAYPRPAGQPTL